MLATLNPAEGDTVRQVQNAGKEDKKSTKEKPTDASVDTKWMQSKHLICTRRENRNSKKSNRKAGSTSNLGQLNETEISAQSIYNTQKVAENSYPTNAAHLLIGSVPLEFQLIQKWGTLLNRLGTQPLRFGTFAVMPSEMRILKRS